jgi:hypothetical protein
MGDKFGSVKMVIEFEYDLDTYADGGEWERAALVDMVKDVFLDDVRDIVADLDSSYVDVKEVQ